MSVTAPTAVPKDQTTAHCATLVQAIDAELATLLATCDETLDSLYASARYTVLGGGKRLRPLLCLLTAEMYGVAVVEALPVACTFELVHNYSLIHDDLPAMDDDDFRRGKPTLHRVYPEGHAILTGDYLLTYAFEVLSRASAFDANVRVALIGLLAESSGAAGMVGGQVLDLAAVGKPLLLPQLEAIHRRKSGRLLQAAIVAGAIMGGAPTHECQLLNRVGDHFGLAFQIIDDILDITDATHKGSTAPSSDLTNDKSTYATLLGIDNARNMALDCLRAMELELATLDRPSTHLATLASSMISRNINHC